MTSWNRENVKAKLEEKGWYESEREIEHATQFTLSDKTKLNFYKTGKIQIQGKDTEIRREAQALFASQGGSTQEINAPTLPSYAPSRVFIVYGHDAQTRC